MNGTLLIKPTDHPLLPTIPFSLPPYSQHFFGGARTSIFFLEENIIGDDDGTGIKNADTLLAERINANERAAPSGEMGCIRRVIVGTRVEISRGIFYEVGVIWFRADEKGNDEV
mmetsp:Transcript_36838/g.77285  ORF Transcript_36838/g.77285 Transcript_36838/m.77285 type:complete len:114 (-) Transcript_36838:206-547(-)